MSNSSTGLDSSHLYDCIQLVCCLQAGFVRVAWKPLCLHLVLRVNTSGLRLTVYTPVKYVLYFNKKFTFKWGTISGKPSC